MRLVWKDRAREDYLYWQVQDRKTLKRIDALIVDIRRTPFEDIGKLEPLRGNLSGYWSRCVEEMKRIELYILNSKILFT